jgi:hypothetical protein
MAVQTYAGMNRYEGCHVQDHMQRDRFITASNTKGQVLLRHDAIEVQLIHTTADPALRLCRCTSPGEETRRYVLGGVRTDPRTFPSSQLGSATGRNSESACNSPAPHTLSTFICALP